MKRLTEIIRNKIAQAGPMPFARFMELALYFPGLGYYEREQSRIGKRGDYYTSVSVGSLFGELLAAQFDSWRSRGIDRPFQIVETGAHDGQLAADILSALLKLRSDSYEDLQYCILEPSPRCRSWQQETLQRFEGRVRWLDALDDLPETSVRGVIFANELLDAFPVHRLSWDGNATTWFQWGVDIQGNVFVWTRMPIVNAPSKDSLQTKSNFALDIAGVRVPDLPAELLAILPDGYTTDVCPAAEAWWRRAAKTLKQGCLLTFDYGLSAEQFFMPERSGGTLRAYRSHSLSNNLLEEPGDQDLTAHVNFTALQMAGEQAGLKTVEWVSQAQFLTRIAQFMWRQPERFAPWTPAQVRQFQTLTHPDHLGRALSVLVQGLPSI